MLEGRARSPSAPSSDNTQPFHPSSRSLPFPRPAFLAALLLALYFVSALTAARTKSATFDEIVHLTAGYNVWRNHDHRFDPGNGDFIKRWAALPLLLAQPNFPPLAHDAWRRADFFPFSRDFFFRSGNDPDALLLPSRAMVALVGVALGALVFACSRALFGPTAALVSLTLFAFCPHMLAHGALVSTDLTLSFALLASTWFLWRLLHVASWPNLLASLLAVSLLAVSKMSAVLFAPIALLLVLARLANRTAWDWRIAHPSLVSSRARQVILLLALAFAHLAVAWTSIWAAFDFRYLARADAADVQLTLLRSTDAPVTGPIAQVAGFCHEHRLLPEGFLKGMEELVGISKRRAAFMNGEWHTGGRAAFFPYAFWVKTPPALLALLALAGAALFTAFATRRSRLFYAAFPLFALLVVYAAVALVQNLNIGHRHLLPLYPALFILAGASTLLLRARPRLAPIALALLVTAYTADSLSARPDYLAYISPVAGGPAEGYRRLGDSSLDWGQDLPGLKQWLATHNADRPATVFFSYFGTSDPDHYDIASWRLPGFPEWRELQVFAYTPGIYAISATMFQQLYTMTFGPWNQVFEYEYQLALEQLRLIPRATADNSALFAALRAHPEPVWQELYNRYEKLRFARLCAWLRATGRAPDAQIGHSILIWRLDATALHAALWSPPLELADASVR